MGEHGLMHAAQHAGAFADLKHPERHARLLVEPRGA